MIRCRIFVKGSVQGVGFRSYAKKNADQLFLTGTVRNTRDGVEIITEGEERSIDEFVKRIKEGPRMSYVQDISTLKQQHKDEFKDFNIAF